MPVNYIAFNLEQTLSRHELVHALAGLLPEGEILLNVISRYNNLLLKKAESGHDRDNILVLMAPFLLIHNIQDSDIGELAAKAELPLSSAPLISELEYLGWKIFCLTSTFKPYALHLIQKIGIFAHNLAATSYPLGQSQLAFDSAEIKTINQLEEDILLRLAEADDLSVKQRLDIFFREELQKMKLFDYVNSIQPVSGQIKLDALKRFADKHNLGLSQWVMVGSTFSDAITLQAVDDAMGMSVAFNAEGSALSHSSAGLASSDLRDLINLLRVWQKGGRTAAMKFVMEKENSGGKGDRGYYSWLSGKTDISKTLEIHRRIRQLQNW